MLLVIKRWKDTTCKKRRFNKKGSDRHSVIVYEFLRLSLIIRPLILFTSRGTPLMTLDPSNVVISQRRVFVQLLRYIHDINKLLMYHLLSHIYKIILYTQSIKGLWSGRRVYLWCCDLFFTFRDRFSPDLFFLLVPDFINKGWKY